MKTKSFVKGLLFASVLPLCSFMMPDDTIKQLYHVIILYLLPQLQII